MNRREHPLISISGYATVPRVNVLQVMPCHVAGVDLTCDLLHVRCN